MPLLRQAARQADTICLRMHATLCPTPAPTCIAIDRYRRDRRQKRVPSECTLSLSELAETLCGDSAEVEYESAVVGQVINTYLRTLSERDMCLFVSRYFCSDSIGDIAEKCGMSESGVKKALLRLREGLREQLEKEGIKL